MNFIYKKRIHAELIIFSFLLLVIDQFTTGNTLFYQNYYMFYWMIPLLSTIFYGNRWGLIAIIYSLSVMFLSITIFILRSILNVDTAIIRFRYLPVSLSSVLVVLYIVSVMINRYRLEITKLHERVKKISIENLHYKRTMNALEIVNKEYESQISRTRDSIPYLYNQLEKFDKLNSAYIIKTLLETIKIFTAVKKATIWCFDDLENNLYLLNSIGYEQFGDELIRDINNSIEGFVYRNNQFFSIRKLKDYKHIKLDESHRNIMTFPIMVGRQVWGVLNIEDIPFEKYNRHNEQLIQIILNLVEHPLEKALDYEVQIQSNDLDRATGLPLYSQFYPVLEGQLTRAWSSKKSLSIMIFELKNFFDLSQHYDASEVLKTFIGALTSTFTGSSHDFMFFKYRERNQVVLLSPSLDEDGVGLYLIQTYKKFANREYSIDDRVVHLDLAVGYATQNVNRYSVTAMLQEAENLLTMSKL